MPGTARRPRRRRNQHRQHRQCIVRKPRQNRDGFVGKAELPERHPLLPNFGMGDKNGDGKLDRKEFANAMAAL